MYLPSDSYSQSTTQEFTVNIPPIELSSVPWECAVESVVYSTGWKTRPPVIHLWLSLMFNDNVVDSRHHKIAYTFVPVVRNPRPHPLPLRQTPGADMVSPGAGCDQNTIGQDTGVRWELQPGGV